MGRRPQLGAATLEDMRDCSARPAAELRRVGARARLGRLPPGTSPLFCAACDKARHPPAPSADTRLFATSCRLVCCRMPCAPLPSAWGCACSACRREHGSGGRDALRYGRRGCRLVLSFSAAGAKLRTTRCAWPHRCCTWMTSVWAAAGPALDVQPVIRQAPPPGIRPGTPPRPQLRRVMMAGDQASIRAPGKDPCTSRTPRHPYIRMVHTFLFQVTHEIDRTSILNQDRG